MILSSESPLALFPYWDQFGPRADWCGQKDERGSPTVQQRAPNPHVKAPEKASRSKERMMAVPFKVSENVFHGGKSKASIQQIKRKAETEQLFTVLLIVRLSA